MPHRANGLTIWQRIHRRWALLGGSYRHPDGRIEFDFDEPAGIDRRYDDEDTQDRKLEKYHSRQSERSRSTDKVVGGIFVAVAVYNLAPHEPWSFSAMGLSALLAYGLWHLTR